MVNSTSLFRPSIDEKRIFLMKTYLWMCFALIVSAIAAYSAARIPVLLNFVWGTRYGFLILAGIEIMLVWTLSASLRTIPVFAAFLMFTAYAAINGLTISYIFILFSKSSIVYSFISTAVMFLLMALYGALTKQSLARAGHYLLMALIGIVVVSLVNTIVTMITRTRLDMLDWVISLATVVIFTGLTAVDSQKILRAAQRADDSDAFKKLAIYGALELYLDFINIFLSLLNLFGKSRD